MVHVLPGAGLFPPHIRLTSVEPAGDYGADRVRAADQGREPFISYPPKKFAAAIGLFVSAGGFLFGLIGFTIVFAVFASILLFFSFLEAAFGLCVGCRIFAFLVKLGWISDEYCPDCVY